MTLTNQQVVLRPPTYHVSRGVLAWRSKLVLDYSFLLANCAGIAEYVVNLGEL